MRQTCVHSFNVTSVLERRGDQDTELPGQRKDYVKQQQEGRHQQAKERGSEETKPSGPLTLGFQTPHWEKIDFCCLSCPVHDILLWQLQQLIQDPQLGPGALGYEFILQKKKVIQGRGRIAHSQVFPGVRAIGTIGTFWKPENEGFSSSVSLCL